MQETKMDNNNMPQKKRGKYRKLEPKKMTEPEEKIFNEWFDKFCLIKVEEPVIRTVCIQLRKKAPNSYETYCESVHAKPVGLKKFNAAIKKKTGSVPKIRHMRKLAFDNIQFSCETPALTSEPSFEMVANNDLGSAL